jgi:hypothetical protein
MVTDPNPGTKRERRPVVIPSPTIIAIPKIANIMPSGPGFFPLVFTGVAVEAGGGGGLGGIGIVGISVAMFLLTSLSIL